MDMTTELKLELYARKINESIENHPKTIILDADEAINETAVKILAEIREVLKNYDIKSMNDFETVEEIVNIFEKYEISTGVCHDF